MLIKLLPLCRPFCGQTVESRRSVHIISAFTTITSEVVSIRGALKVPEGDVQLRRRQVEVVVVSQHSTLAQGVQGY
ncbi:hypothetical protein O3P69_009660 [Scylla paramamosain]|uniref:Secreted protein n=1 Tax=Scylla paramamosain TaxID=85552 RepID=A0AAW0SC40_SCYPA